MPRSIFSQTLKGHLIQIDKALSLCRSLLSGTRPVNSGQPVSPKLLISAPSVQDCYALLRFHLSALQSEKRLQAESWSNQETPPLFHLPIISSQSKSAPLTATALTGIPPVFPSLKVHSAVMSIVQCLKRVAEYIFFSSFIVVYSGRASSVAVTPSWSKGMFLHKLHNLHVHLGGYQVAT